MIRQFLKTTTGAFAALVSFLASSAFGEAPRLAQPVDCILGKTCYIQNYVDDDPGPGASDYRCHGLTYDGHRGTDFALPTRAVMEQGVTVRAAAPGEIIGVRDGEMDGAYLKDRASTKGKECGNGVVVDHGDGWQTQYCHMRQGSISVSKGDKVDTGTPLGQVGLSGKTQFPHLHIAVRHDGKVVDPFDPVGAAICTGASLPVGTLWVDPPDYRPGGLLTTGFSGAIPDYDAIKAGRASAHTLRPDAPYLILWAYGFGARKGDSVTLTITGPQGFHASTTAQIDANKAAFSRHFGTRHRGDWPEGAYQGTVTFIRDSQKIGQATARMTVNR